MRFKKLPCGRCGRLPFAEFENNCRIRGNPRKLASYRLRCICGNDTAYVFGNSKEEAKSIATFLWNTTVRHMSLNSVSQQYKSIVEKLINLGDANGVSDFLGMKCVEETNGHKRN